MQLVHALPAIATSIASSLVADAVPRRDLPSLKPAGFGALAGPAGLGDLGGVHLHLDRLTGLRSRARRRPADAGTGLAAQPAPSRPPGESKPRPA